MSKLEGDLLDGRPLVDGTELELLLAGSRWIPARWRDSRLELQLGGDWEQDPNGQPFSCTIQDLDLARAELRRTESPARATRVMALAKWIEAQVPEPDAPVDLDVLRANRQFVAELPRVIEEYQLKLRDHSFDLFHAASHFGAAQKAGVSDLAEVRAQLEEAAVKFDDTSRWLSALQVMQADQD
jgi:hypothetical protein